MKEITPVHLRCAWGSCPGVYDMEDGNLRIVGTCEETGEERAIIIKREFFDGIADRTPEDEPF